MTSLARRARTEIMRQRSRIVSGCGLASTSRRALSGSRRRASCSGLLRQAAVFLLLLIVGVPVAGASGGPEAETIGAERLVRKELGRFLRAGAADPTAEIQLPKLHLYRAFEKHAGPTLRAELTTRSSPPYAGRVPITVALYDEDRLLHRGIVSTYLEVPEEAVFARRSLRRGEILSEGDLMIVSRDRAKLPRDVLTDLGEAVGKRMRRSIREGQPFRTNAIEVVPVIERGDRVMLILEAGALQLQASGRAQQAGGIGEFIRVMNLDSKREILGRVDGQGRVRVTN